jgi:hypothetical protein
VQVSEKPLEVDVEMEAIERALGLKTLMAMTVSGG